MVRTHIRLCFLHLAPVVFLDIRNVRLDLNIYQVGIEMGDDGRCARMGYMGCMGHYILIHTIENIYDR